MTKFERKEWLILKCDFCGAEDSPRLINFTKHGMPRREDLPDGWAISGCLDNHNLRAWCPDHAKPLPRRHHAISPPLKPLTPEEQAVLYVVD